MTFLEYLTILCLLLLVPAVFGLLITCLAYLLDKIKGEENDDW